MPQHERSLPSTARRTPPGDPAGERSTSLPTLSSGPLPWWCCRRTYPSSRRGSQLLIRRCGWSYLTCRASLESPTGPASAAPHDPVKTRARPTTLRWANAQAAKPSCDTMLPWCSGRDRFGQKASGRRSSSVLAWSDSHERLTVAEWANSAEQLLLASVNLLDPLGLLIGRQHERWEAWLLGPLQQFSDAQDLDPLVVAVPQF